MPNLELDEGETAFYWDIGEATLPFYKSLHP